jgi:hypothetical protein
VFQAFQNAAQGDAMLGAKLERTGYFALADAAG